MKSKKMQRVWSALLLLCLPYGIGVAPLRADNKAAVDVNGDKIYAADVDRVMTMMQDREPTLKSGTEASKKALQDLRDSVIDNFIVQKLLVQEAKRQNITVPTATIDKSFKDFKADYGDDEAFKKAMAAEGKTPEDVRRTLNEELVLRELTSRMTADIKVTDADVKAYYNAHLDEFKVPEMVRARHILLAYPENAPKDVKEALRVKANELLKKAQAKGADFSQLARENTDDVGTKDSGGDLDFATRGTFVEPFEKAIFESPLGVVPRVVESEFGLHIIRVEEKQAARTAKFEEIKDDQQLRLDLRKDKIKQRLDDKIAELRKNAKVTKY